MREKLATLLGKRCTFVATFQRFGSKPQYKGPPLKTVLVVAVKDERGEEWTDHAWFVARKQWNALPLEPGDVVKFTATVKRYTKGYKGRRDDDEYDDRPPVTEDYKLAFPLNVRLFREPKPLDPLDEPLFESGWQRLRQAMLPL